MGFRYFLGAKHPKNNENPSLSPPAEWLPVLIISGLSVRIKGIDKQKCAPTGVSKRRTGRNSYRILERVVGFEPATSCLGSKRSTTELHPLNGPILLYFLERVNNVDFVFWGVRKVRCAVSPLRTQNKDLARIMLNLVIVVEA